MSTGLIKYGGAHICFYGNIILRLLSVILYTQMKIKVKIKNLKRPGNPFSTFTQKNGFKTV